MNITTKPIEFVNFPSDQYYREETNKKQIVLHHTVSGEGVNGDLTWWLTTASRIATHFVIARDGTPYQCFNSKYWGHHLGITSSVFIDFGFKTALGKNLKLNKESISIEIDSWGGLVEKDGEFYPAKWHSLEKRFTANTNCKPLHIDDVVKYEQSYRGFKYFEKYTDAQIQTVEELCIYFGSKYAIPLDYNDAMWGVNIRALAGVEGIWTHTSYRKDKSDCHPQAQLVDMLKHLKT